MEIEKILQKLWKSIKQRKDDVHWEMLNLKFTKTGELFTSSYSFLRIININCDCQREEVLCTVFSKLTHPGTICLTESLVASVSA